VIYETARALTPSDTQKAHTYLGVVRGEIETDLGFKIGGPLELIGNGERDWHEGDTVSRGTLLARLKQADFQAAFDQTAAETRFASQRWTNNHQLYFAKDPAISRQEWEKTDAEFRAAEAKHEQARQALEDSKILAPFDGKVLARLVNSGEMVLPSRTVLRLAKVRPFVSVEFGVPDRVVTSIKPGQTIPLHVSAFEWKRTNFLGVVSEVGAGAKEGSRLFRVVLRVPNDEDLLRSGMTASVTFENQRLARPGDVLVRLSALVAASAHGNPARDENQLAVFVVDEAAGCVRERTVATDDILRSSIIVTNGLAAGDKVVVVGAGLLQDGVRVRAVPVKSDPASEPRVAPTEPAPQSKHP
jgi:RND family efflux transporter MFP subunit